MPSASVSSAAEVKPGPRSSTRMPWRISRTDSSNCRLTMWYSMVVAPGRLKPDFAKLGRGRLNTAALHLLHQVIAAAYGQGHESEGRILTPARHERGRVHHIQVGDVMGLEELVENRRLRITSHPGGSHLVDAVPRNTIEHRERLNVLRACSFHHLRCGHRHVGDHRLFV